MRIKITEFSILTSLSRKLDELLTRSWDANGVRDCKVDASDVR